MWQDNLIDDEKEQVNQFAGGLQNRAVTWYMNFLEEGPKTTKHIKDIFLELFNTDDTNT